MEVDEYSNSSRLHLAGDSAVVVESFYQTDGGMYLNFCFISFCLLLHFENNWN